jgi:hypothetical protein
MVPPFSSILQSGEIEMPILKERLSADQQCHWCGYPSEVGEEIYRIEESDDRIFCGEYCCEEYIRSVKPPHDMRGWSIGTEEDCFDCLQLFPVWEEVKGKAETREWHGRCDKCQQTKAGDFTIAHYDLLDLEGWERRHGVICEDCRKEIS